MGKLDLDLEAILELSSEKGMSPPQIAEYMGVSAPTIRARIRELNASQSVLLEYRAVQSLQLTGLQFKILEAITPDKINDASLSELISAFKILKERELNLEGKPGEIKGLISYLVLMEKKESGKLTPEEEKEFSTIIDTEVVDPGKSLEQVLTDDEEEFRDI